MNISFNKNDIKWIGEGPTVVSSYNEPKTFQGWMISQWRNPLLHVEHTSPYLNSIGDWKYYPTHDGDWSGVPKEVWNPNCGACYPKWHIEQSIHIQVEGMWKLSQ